MKKIYTKKKKRNENGNGKSKEKKVLSCHSEKSHRYSKVVENMQKSTSLAWKRKDIVAKSE